MYETKITDAKWLAYDIPGNIGWIMYLMGVILIFTKKPDFLEYWGMFAIAVIAVFPALLMVVGIIELINERICKLDRVLPKIRLWRGFGSLTLGGVSGIVISVIGLIYGIFITECDLKYLWIMLVGAILCAVFAGVLFKGYKMRR